MRKKRNKLHVFAAVCVATILGTSGLALAQNGPSIVTDPRGTNPAPVISISVSADSLRKPEDIGFKDSDPVKLYEKTNGIKLLYEFSEPEYLRTSNGVITKGDTCFVFLTGLCEIDGHPCSRLVMRRYFQGEYEQTFVDYIRISDSVCLDEYVYTEDLSENDFNLKVRTSYDFKGE